MRQARLGDFLAKRSRGIIPASTPDDTFELYSVPAFEGKRPEVVTGGQIGSNKQIVEPGTVLLCKINPRINRAWVVGSFTRHQKIASTEWITFPPQPDVEPRYLAHYLSRKEIRDYLAANASGVGGSLMRVKASTVEDLPVPLPNFDEQRRIVAEIEKQFSRVDEAVANLKRAEGNLARFSKAMLSAAVAGRVVPTESALSEASGTTFESGADLLRRVLVARKQHWSGRGQYSDPTPPDTRGLSALPKGWTWASADQLSDFITKGTTPAASKLAEGAGDVQFLKVYNLTFDGSLNLTYKPAFVSRDTHERDLARSRVRPGDVLINIVGPPLGQVSMVPAELPEANINQAIARIRPVAPLSTRYIALALMATEIMDWAVRRAKTTAGQSNLTLELCRAIPIPLPPLVELHRIVAEVDRRLSIVREVEGEVDANLKRAQALRQAVLASTFAGGLWS